MASSKNSLKPFSTVFGAIFPFGDFFYILQQEEYDPSRYVHWLPRFFFRRNFQVRDRLDRTRRVTASCTAALVLWLGTAALVLHSVRSEDFILRTLVVILWLLLIPFFVLAGDRLLAPYYDRAKRRIMRRAARRIGENKGMKIVAVAGSFGKTTAKNFMYDLVRYNYATQMIPGNINTPLGIAAWTLSSLRKGTQLLVVEMDAYKKGEIAASASVAAPDIAIVTNVGDQHLVRFGSKENLAVALKEVFLGAKPGARLLCTGETAAALGPLGPGRESEVVEAEKTLAFLSGAVRARFSSSNMVNLAFAVRVAEALGIPQAFIVDTCGKLELPDRRQKTVEWHGYRCIDDSYNISLTTARAGLDAARDLARREGKKLLVITAGIPESGPENRDDNMRLGSAIAAGADRAVILKSMFADDIAKGIGDRGKYSTEKSLDSFIMNARAAFPPGEWVILLQPELTDLYY